MKVLSHLCLLVLVIALASCESDELASNNSSLEKKLVLNPTSLEGEQYVQYFFKAKVTNVPFSDVMMYWDFDEGRGFHTDSNLMVQSVGHTYYKPKIYTVRVKALDFFTEELLGYDSIRVDIRPPIAFAEIVQAPIDTILAMNSLGKMIQAVQFSVVASAPKSVLRTEWNFGDGGDPVQGNYASPPYLYERVGTYIVRVTVRDSSGVYLGTDSVQVTLRFPPLGFSSISTAQAIGVVLDLDSLDPLRMSDTLLQGPLSLGLLMKGNPNVISEFGTATVMTRYDYQNASSQIHDTIQGEFSEDMRTIKKIRVSVNDAGYAVLGNDGELAFSYTLHDLELLAVASDKVVYRSKSPLTPDFANDIFFEATVKNRFRGNFDTGSLPEVKQAPFGLVVIFR